MQKAFLTEKEMESYLKLESRVIPWINGEKHFFTSFKLFWQAYDFVIGFAGWTPEQIVSSALESKRRNGRSFEENFRSVVAYVNETLKEHYREQIAIGKREEGDLVVEQRMIPYLDGNLKSFSACKLFWVVYDYLVTKMGWTPETLTEAALEHQRKTGDTFEWSLRMVVNNAEIDR